MRKTDFVKLLTPHQIGSMLNIDHKTILHWINTKNLPAFKHERVVRLIPKDIKRFLNEHWTTKTQFRANFAR